MLTPIIHREASSTIQIVDSIKKNVKGILT